MFFCVCVCIFFMFFFISYVAFGQEVQALTTACRNTEAEASRLRQMVGKAEEEAAAAVLREGQQVQARQEQTRVDKRTS